MRPSFLIARNFAREQRWPLFFLLLWVLGWAVFGVFADPRSGPDDALLIFRQLAVYSVTFGVFFGRGFTASWLLGRFGFDEGAMWFGILALWTACLLTASLTLSLSTFLPPLFAAIGAGTVAGIPALLALRGDAFSKYVIPVRGLLDPLIRADFAHSWHASVGTVCLGWVETAAFWFLAAWIFSRRDLSVAVE